MASYVVTGSSQGLGFAFLKKLAQDPKNQIFGLARNKSTLEAKLKEAGITNVTAITGDVGNSESVQKAAQEVSKITGGTLDVLINNAAYVSEETNFGGMSTHDPKLIERDILDSFKVNALGLVYTITAFLPLVRKSAGKVINISTGMADIDLTNSIEIPDAGPYSISKAASNVVIAKYNAEFGKEGVLFLSISPGYVATETNIEAGSKYGEQAQAMGAKFAAYAPHFKAPLTPEESVTAVLGVIAEKSVKNGDGGQFISHLGNKQWL